MNTWKTQLKTMLLLVSFLLIGMFVLQGCKKSEPSGSGASSEKKEETDGQKWTCSMHPDIIADGPGKCSACGMDLVPQKAEQKRGAMKMPMPMPAKEIAAAAVQTTCPIMGGAINKDLFIEYKGKKVYFCCPGCVDTFKENPEKYLDKLPQFKE